MRMHCQLTYLGRGTMGGARRRQATIGCCWGMGVATAGGSSAWTMLPDVTTWTTIGLVNESLRCFVGIFTCKLEQLWPPVRTLAPFDLWEESGGAVGVRWRSGSGAFSCLSET